MLPFPQTPDSAAPPSQALFSYLVKVPFVFWLLLRQSKVCAAPVCVTPANGPSMALQESCCPCPVSPQAVFLTHPGLCLQGVPMALAWP